MKYLVLLLPLTLMACASSQVAKQLRYVSYEDKASEQKSAGTIEGRDCSWSVLGYSLGQPTVRSAFVNASANRREGFVPGQSGEQKGAGLKTIKNISVEDDGFNVWVVGRQCILVTGEGYL